jgi:hypothetical protein
MSTKIPPGATEHLRRLAEAGHEIPTDPAELEFLRRLEEQGVWLKVPIGFAPDGTALPDSPASLAVGMRMLADMCRMCRSDVTWDDVEQFRDRASKLREADPTLPELPPLPATEAVRPAWRALLEWSEGAAGASCSFSDDYTSADWFGTRYTFAKGNQAASVRVLAEAFQSGGHSLSQETIRERIGSNADKFDLRKVFRSKGRNGGYKQHPAWGTMIRQDGKGAYRLAPPESA